VIDSNNVDNSRLVARRRFTASIILRLSYGGSERRGESVVSVRLPGIPRLLSKSVPLSEGLMVVACKVGTVSYKGDELQERAFIDFRRENVIQIIQLQDV
jgi:hypothetical protein